MSDSLIVKKTHRLRVETKAHEVPRFVKRFGAMADEISAAAAAYAADVRSRAFPTPDQTYQPKD